nr:D-alanyl-D-alanine carboxypeptidase/D-alanyl-D-alanine-endopeptidase [Halorhodospira abdelmalekii]
MPLLLPLLLLLLAAPAGASGDRLPEPIAAAMRAQNLPPDVVGLWVQRVGDPEPLAQLNAHRPFNPASTMKLATTLAALAELGPTYTWKTTIYATAPVRDGVLKGDLVLRGTGDPGMVSEEHWRMLGALRRTGLQRIEGDVLLDTRFFDLPREDPGAFDGQPLRAYNQPPHALHVNANAVRFHIIPDPVSQQIRIEPDPPLPGLEIVNQLRAVHGSCNGWLQGLHYAVDNSSAPPRVILAGDYPVNCGDNVLLRTAISPESYNRKLFRLHWEQWGGELLGEVRYGAPADSADEAMLLPLLVNESRPLSKLIRVANKWSLNVAARHLALTLAAERNGPPATLEESREAIYQVLAGLGVDVRGMIVDNGSGLSRTARMTPAQLAQVLQAGWESPWRPEFVSSLALAGMDGTLHRRFRNGPETGRMHLKTGHLNQVSAVAGYVRNRSNEDVIVVLLVNYPTAHRGSGRQLQEAVLRWVHNL